METGGDAFVQMNDELYTNGDGNTLPLQQPRVVISGDHLDVEAYAALYSGRTKITRLLFIGDKCDDVFVQLEALRMAYDEIKNGEDTKLYGEVVRKIDGRLGPDYVLDSLWMDAVNRRAEQKKEKLENQLNAYRTNMTKESMRMGYNDFGDFYYARGALGDAFKNYVRTRDFCTTATHVVHMCVNAILVSIEMGNFPNVSNYISKAEQSKKDLDPIIVSKLHCAAGLAHLDAKKYKQAARKFLETSPELGDNYSEVIAAQDVAIYGGICALASFDRLELKANVIDNISFRNFLELVPEVRELINDFYSSCYASCLDYLAKLKPNLLLDIHMHDHVEKLYTLIRNKAIIQYTIPFISVDLNMMANAFKTTVTELQKELEALITDNKIQARVDSQNKILYARHTDQRNGTFQQVLQTGVELERDVKAMVLRANLIKNRYNLKESKKVSFLT